jgi:hypothetical protein
MPVVVREIAMKENLVVPGVVGVQNDWDQENAPQNAALVPLAALQNALWIPGKQT